jgi:hypothetical protein
MAQSFEAVGTPFPARANCGDGPRRMRPTQVWTPPDACWCRCADRPTRLTSTALAVPLGAGLAVAAWPGIAAPTILVHPPRRSRPHNRVSSARSGLGLIGRDDELGELDQFMAGCDRYALAAGMFLQTVLRACRPGRRRLRAGIRRR